MNQFLGAVSQVLGRKCRKIVLTFSFSNAVGCHPKATSMLKPPVPGLPGSPLGFFCILRGASGMTSSTTRGGVSSRVRLEGGDSNSLVEASRLSGFGLEKCS